MEKQLHSIDGEEVGSIHLADRVFGVDVNEGLIHRLLVMELANKRQGSASTKRRGEVRGSTLGELAPGISVLRFGAAGAWFLARSLAIIVRVCPKR